ncbi:alkaline phosphatase D family protein [Pseudomonas putida]
MTDPSRIDLPRRRLITAVGAGMALSILSPFARSSGIEQPFTLGVASGDPLPDGFVIWTRLAPEHQVLSRPVAVRWMVASDAAMTRIVRSGHVQADARLAHSVHVEVTGLQPARPYWYRFEALGEQSAIGRAITAPVQMAAALNMGFVSCSHWERGYFSAYRHLAAENPDLVFFLGDYIYENSYPASSGKVVRAHAIPEARDLDGYRNRYTQYKRDPDLQALHATAPCVVTWDDHEVQNDYANRWSQDAGVDPQAFLKRRAAAYQAFYEHMPLRRSSLPHGPDMRVYRRLEWGPLARIHVLDGRQYRTEQPCVLPDGRHGGHVATCAALSDPQRTMLGWEQEKWLRDGLRQSRTGWNIVAQDLLMAPLDQQDPHTHEWGHWTDGWDGYEATRDRVLANVQQSGARNPVFFGGDIHSFWTTDLKVGAKVVATEFVGTSVTSDGPPYEAFKAVLPRNPHVRFFDSRQRGYVSVSVDARRMETRFQALSDCRDPGATVSTLKRFIVEDGRPGAQDA